MGTITMETDEEVTVTARKQKYDYPPFIMVGNGEQNKNGQSIDIVDTLCTFSKPEQMAFKKISEQLECLKDSRKKHNACVVKNKDLGKAQQNFKTGVSSLINKGLVKRIKREHYLINPDLIITKNYLEDKIEWNKY